jgi:hypothetical protein
MYIELYYHFTTARASLSVYTQRCICIEGFTTVLLQRGIRSLYSRRSVCKRFTTAALLLGSHSLSIHSGVYVHRALLLLYYCSGLSPSTHIEVYTYKELCYCFATARASLSVYTPRCICVWRFTTALLQHGIHSLSIHSGVYVHRVLLLPHYSACLALSIYMAVYMYKELYYCFNIVRDSLSVHT